METKHNSVEYRPNMAPRSSIEHLVNAINAHENNDTDAGSPRKKQKRSPPPAPPAGDIPISKKGRACTACRRLKVKCDSTERGLSGCSRCQRLGLECINNRKLRMSLDGENEQAHSSFTRLERAVEDILQRLKMPSLDVYAKPSQNDINVAKKTPSEFQATRENSKEPGDGEQDVGPAPMGSLYEVTQLKSLRSRLRQTNNTRKSSRRNIEADLISQKLIPLDDAEEMLQMYKTVLARYLFSVTMAEDATLQQVRESSTLLFTAVMLVSALHIPGKEAIHAICHKQFVDLVATSVFEQFHTLDDIRALCIAAFWQPDLSWKLSGLAVRMATELNLHQSFYSAFYTPHLVEEQRNEALEKARVWYLLYVLDHHFSIAYGRPPVTAELLPIKEWETFVKSPWSTIADRRLLSQVSLFVVLSKAFKIFGLEPERSMGEDDATLSIHRRFTEEARAWKDRWKDLVMPDKYVGDYPKQGVIIHHHFSSLVLNSLALRGRRLDAHLPVSLPLSLRPMALQAIQSAHSILQFFLDEPSYRDSLVGVPLYLHSMIAFAVVFLMKLSHQWHTIGVTIDPKKRTKPLIEGVIQVLKACKAGNGHMVYSMASGFERLLKTTTWSRTDTGPQFSDDNQHQSIVSQTRHYPIDTKGSSENQNLRLQPQTRSQADHIIDHNVSRKFDANMESPEAYQARLSNTQQPQLPRPGIVYSTQSNPNTSSYFGEYQLPVNTPTGRDVSRFDDYSFDLQDNMLWSAGLGYDLLNTNRQDFSDYSLGFDYSGLSDASSGVVGSLTAQQQPSHKRSLPGSGIT